MVVPKIVVPEAVVVGEDGHVVVHLVDGRMVVVHVGCFSEGLQGCSRWVVCSPVAQVELLVDVKVVDTLRV